MKPTTVPDIAPASPDDLQCARCSAPHARTARFCRVCGHRHGTPIAGQLVVQEVNVPVPAAASKVDVGRPARPRPPVESWAILVDERTGMLQLPAELTAERTFSPGQVRAFAITGLVILAAFFVQPIMTMTLLVAAATILYLASMAYRMKAFLDALRAPAEIRISDDGGPRRPRRRLADLHGPGAGLPRARGHRAPHRRHRRVGLPAPQARRQAAPRGG